MLPIPRVRKSFMGIIQENGEAKNPYGILVDKGSF